MNIDHSIKYEQFLSYLHSQVQFFYDWHCVENRPSKAAAVICVSFVFHSGQFLAEQTEQSAGHIDVCISVSWNTDEDASGPRGAL